MHPYAYLRFLVAADCDENSRRAWEYESRELRAFFRKDPANPTDPLKVLGKFLAHFTLDGNGQFTGFAHPMTYIQPFLNHFGMELDIVETWNLLAAEFRRGPSSAAGITLIIEGEVSPM